MTIKKITSNLLCVVVLFAVLSGAFILVDRSDTAIMEKMGKYTLATAQEVAPAFLFSLDEQRIAAHFATDTLPGLMQKGLIKKYTRDRKGSSLLVAGSLWSKRTSYFKHCLLLELFVYNKVNGYESWTRVVDSESGKLYAEITPPTKIEFYD